MKELIENIPSLPNVDLHKLISKVEEQMTESMTDNELYTLIAETAATMAIEHPDYALFAGMVMAYELHQNTPDTFMASLRRLELLGILSDELIEVADKNRNKIEEAIIHKNDFAYDVFAMATLKRAYLMKNKDGKIIERPQYMLMRVALGIHGYDIEEALRTYRDMSNKLYTHATPTLFNSGTRTPQMASCFLLDVKGDSVHGIFDTNKDCGLISKVAGGIGVSFSKVRANESYIAGTGGKSNGIVPMLKMFNETARYINQGGKRKGSIAAYIEPWHADVLEFLDLRKNHGKEELRARDLFYALWIPDLFMKRVQENGDWSLFCPNEAKGLDNVWGEEFEALYAKYEAKGLARKTIKAQELWRKIIDTQIETGTPYMLYKDQANAKSNQQNLGTIRSSNLCSEIIEYTSPEEAAVCNLASISLPACVKDKEFDFELLYEISRQLTRNLNKVIDRSYYPIPEAEYSNKKHRPIGIGVQGLADVFAMMDMPFDSEEAKELNKVIFETIYYGAVMESTFLAKKYGKYDSYRNSPADKGLLQFDLWGVEPSGKYDWNFVKHLIRKQGLRNSLLIAPMPTASTSQLLGNNECFEPYTSNIYLRRVLSGEFVVVNKHLVKDLQALGLWNDRVRNQIVQANGSVQRVIGVPKHLKDKYKTVWEISQKVIIDMAADRGAYVCQSQSMNIHLADPTVAKISSMHMYAWRKGLKTGMYYLRTPSAADAMKICESCSG